MVRSISHTHTRAWHRAHSRHFRRTLIIMALVLIVAGVFAAFGYFGTVDWPVLVEALLRTTYRLALAYSIALVLGTLVALLVGWSPFSDALFPVFDILQNVPSFALIPFFIFFFGFTDQMVIFFAVTSIVWPILFSVLTGIKNAHIDLNDAATIFGARGFRRVYYYLAPLSFPAILTGSIVGIAVGWEAVIGSEIIVEVAGFGSFIKSASLGGIDEAALAGLLAILVLVFAINRLVWAPLLAENSKKYAE